MIRSTPDKLKRSASKRGWVPVCLGLGLAGAAVWLSACGKEQPEDPVVIKINEREYRASELQSQIHQLRASGSSSLRSPETFFETFIDRQIALEAARRKGLDNDPELLRQWENLLIGRLRQDALEAALAAISISDERVEAYYAEHLDDYSVPARLRAALLRLEADAVPQFSGNQETARARMESARAEAENLPDEVSGFGALAMRYSDEGSSRFKGGDIGWMQAGRESYRWPELVVEALFNLSPDMPLSPVIETSDAVYLVKYIDSRPEQVRPLDAALKQGIRGKLLAQERAKASASVEAAWTREVAVEFDRNAAEQLNFSSPEFQFSNAENLQSKNSQ